MNTLHQTIRDLFSAAPEPITLCGSRGFAMRYPEIIKVNDDTDWDFYAKHTPQMCKWMEDNGFSACAAAHLAYADNDTLGIFTKTLDDGTSVEVTLRKDPARYGFVLRSLISPTYYRDYLWKSGPNKPCREMIRAQMNHLYHAADHAMRVEMVTMIMSAV